MTLLLGALLLGCGGDKATVDDTAAVDDTGDTDDSGVDDPCFRVDGATGALSLTFEMDADYIDVMSEAPVGTFYGSVFACEDASAVGPADDATALLDLEVAGLDLSDGGGPVDPGLTTDPVSAEYVWVLGCLDSDGNGCDKGDPVTVPSANRVVVVPDQTTALNVYFGILNPS